MTTLPETLLPEGFASSVVAWGEPRLRDLPWRRTRDPWAILVSEVMLQQTQIARVIPRWSAFLERWPTADDCARSALGDVLAAWQGLGYPRRARNLHRAADAIAEAGSFPTGLDELLELPGVGPYTARAVRAFAFECDDGVVDTNIARVYARYVGERLTARAVQTLADSAVPAGHGWLWNQCLMDLGAVCCRPVPRCDACPLAHRCSWRGVGADPAVGTSGVSTKQSRFEGSDRQARGQLMRALAAGSVNLDDVAEIMGRPESAAARLVQQLADDGLCELDGDRVRLPR